MQHPRNSQISCQLSSAYILGTTHKKKEKKYRRSHSTGKARTLEERWVRWGGGCCFPKGRDGGPGLRATLKEPRVFVARFLSKYKHTSVRRSLHDTYHQAGLVHLYRAHRNGGHLAVLYTSSTRPKLRTRSRRSVGRSCTTSDTAAGSLEQKPQAVDPFHLHAPHHTPTILGFLHGLKFVSTSADKFAPLTGGPTEILLAPPPPCVHTPATDARPLLWC